MNYKEAKETLLKMAFAESTEFAEDRLFAFGYSDEHTAFSIAIAELNDAEHDGCCGCAYESVEEWEMPCCKCKQGCKDYYRRPREE